MLFWKIVHTFFYAFAYILHSVFWCICESVKSEWKMKWELHAMQKEQWTIARKSVLLQIVRWKVHVMAYKEPYRSSVINSCFSRQHSAILLTCLLRYEWDCFLLLFFFLWSLDVHTIWLGCVYFLFSFLLADDTIYKTSFDWILLVFLVTSNRLLSAHAHCIHKCIVCICAKAPTVSSHIFADALIFSNLLLLLENFISPCL